MRYLLPLALLLQPQTPAPLERLRASMETITRSVNANWGIYVKSLESGEEIALDADRQMETMSTIKIPLMIEAFEQIKAGTFMARVFCRPMACMRVLTASGPPTMR